jgi:hypothetical protein
MEMESADFVEEESPVQWSKEKVTFQGIKK